LATPKASNRRIAVEDAIDADPLATAVRELIAARGPWAGSTADLLLVKMLARRE
jgi:hypothetical protein